MIHTVVGYIDSASASRIPSSAFGYVVFRSVHFCVVFLLGPCSRFIVEDLEKIVVREEPLEGPHSGSIVDGMIVLSNAICVYTRMR